MTDPAPHLSSVAPPRPARGVGVRIDNAHPDYDGDALFTGLAMRIAPGRWTCVLGPSGVGKTTLLRMIAGLAAPVKDTRIAADDGGPLADRLAWMAQRDLLLPWLGALENTMLGARLRGEQPAPDRARALLARVGLGGRDAVRPAALSGGQRQRVALARTLMEDRPVVLMDEPFSALDAVTRSRLQDLAATLLRGRTVVLVTHDPLEALRLGDAVHVMAGRPATLGAPLEPAGTAPRDPADAAILERLARLADDMQPGDQVIGLSDRQIARHIQAAAKAAGLGDGFTGHSSRVGLTQRMSKNGAPDSAVICGRADGHQPGWSPATRETKRPPKPSNISSRQAGRPCRRKASRLIVHFNRRPTHNDRRNIRH